MFDYANTTALVTGASSGLGETFARALAARGAALVLVARGAEKLEALAAELRASHKVEADVIVADLSQSSASASVHAEARRRGFAVNLLVNNAGFGLSGAFLDHPLEREAEQIAVNITALTQLSHLFGNDMRHLGRNAGIINIASSAAFQPLAYAAVYAASKTYVLHFSEALGRELVGQGTHVLAVCPGPVKTAFFDKVGSNLADKAMDAPERIVAEALAAFDKRKAVLIPGRLAVRAQALGARLLPRATLVRMAEPITRKVMMGGRR